MLVISFFKAFSPGLESTGVIPQNPPTNCLVPDQISISYVYSYDIECLYFLGSCWSIFLPPVYDFYDIKEQN